MLPWNEFFRCVDRASHVLLTTHVRPDGDALGSELGMAELLRYLGKSVEILNASPTPKRYAFLDPNHEVRWLDAQLTGPVRLPDVIVVLDTGTWSQLDKMSDVVRRASAQKIVIDHHRTQDDLGTTLRIVDVESSACGMLVLDAFRNISAPISPVGANALFAAIATDTGWMRHSNTTPEVLRSLGDLIAHGAQPTDMYRRIYDCNSLERMKLLSILLNKMVRSADGKLIHATILQSDIQATGAHPMDTEDFINHLMSVDGVEVALLLIEQLQASTKVSVRSRERVDCSKLTEIFGGGGHQRAAGAMVRVPPESALPQWLDAIAQALAANG